MGSPEEDLTPILQQMGAFHLKWVALNDKCRTLQSSLTEANSKNEELEMKLARSMEQTAKSKEENRKLTVVINKLQRKFQKGYVHNLIDTLKQNIHVYEECVLPYISEITKCVTRIDDDDLNGSCSEYENDPKLHTFSTVVDDSLISVNSCANRAQDNRPKVIVEPISHSEIVTKSKPTLSTCSLKKLPINPISLKNLVQPRVQNIQKKTIADTSCDSKIASSCVTISSTTGEKSSETSVISKSTLCADKCNSSTSSQSNNISTTNETEPESIAIPQANVISKSLENRVQSSFIDVSNIESMCIVEEQVADSDPPSHVKRDSPHEASSLGSNSESSLNRKEENEEITNHENCEEKPNVLVLLPPMIVCKVSKDDGVMPRETNDLETKDSKTNQSERLKRPCSSPLTNTGSLPKRPAVEESASSCSTLKCLICEYEDIDNNKIYETYLALDDHIIEKHPDPNPPYIRCMFNNGQCTRHFHPKQNFHKHVKRAHPGEDLDLKLENQRRLLKCTVCSKLFLFKSDIIEHNTQIHGKTPNTKKIIRNVTCRKKSSVVECEVCKKDNRLSAKYRLYDELDAHISKCHSDPFPEYLRCPYCTRHFRNVKWLTSHIVKKHADKYTTSPLEKFLPSETRLAEGNEQITNATETSESKSMSKEVCPLRILSPSSINNAVFNAVTSLTSN